MVINREQFLELVNLAKEKQLILEEAYTPFHMPVMNKIKEAIDAGKIGKVCEVQANFSAAIKKILILRGDCTIQLLVVETY